jgi:molybdate transport system substrate-binding protein
VRKRLATLGLIAIVTMGLASCSNDAAQGDVTADVGAVPIELTVSAASSLTEAFTEIGTGFEAANDNTHVVLNLGPSDGLASQIQEGGGVDVFASASPTWMEAVQDDPGVTGRTDFAKNRLAVLVPTDNPAGITSLADVAKPGVKLVLAAESVPAGDYARQIFDNAGITDDAMAVITKLLSGDADAGIGYVTDVTPQVSDQVSLIEIPDDENVIATYPIAVVTGSDAPALAQAFVDYVTGPGQDVLAEYGFLPAS